MGPKELLETKKLWDKRAADSEARIDRERHVLAFIHMQQARIIGELASQGVYVLPCLEEPPEQSDELTPPDAS